jgi:CDP-diacylglycerol pyrophosphatase
VKLAEKFECSQFFVSLCCSAPEIKEQRDKELAHIKSKWGRKKTEAREDRQTRKALWGRDA